MTLSYVWRLLLTTVLLARACDGVCAGSGADWHGVRIPRAAVLPGVTVTAVHEATGNRFEAVTDERGRFRIPARVGAYQLTA